MNNNPIGIFDSGVGGLSIWKELNQLLPNESTIYIADSINTPYGNKSKEKITELSVRNTELLLTHQCKLIVVACNTATTNSIRLLRKTYSVPFIGIEPATRSAAIKTKTGKIGILATKGTLASELFLNTSQQYRGDVEIIEAIGAGLVAIIESGNIDDAEPLLRKYLTPMVDRGVDNIVLGCTHYPFLKSVIEKIIPPSITIIDSGLAVAKRTQHVLVENDLLNSSEKGSSHLFHSNGDTKVLTQFLEKIGVVNYSIEGF
ncbi:MAG: glutamate racemase [Flavobacteriales bacterium]|nr:glutamate racemase [Flavobacteriales bacterium]